MCAATVSVTNKYCSIDQVTDCHQPQQQQLINVLITTLLVDASLINRAISAIVFQQIDVSKQTRQVAGINGRVLVMIETINACCIVNHT